MYSPTLSENMPLLFKIFKRERKLLKAESAGAKSTELDELNSSELVNINTDEAIDVIYPPSRTPKKQEALQAILNLQKKTKNKEALEAMKNEKDGKKKDWRIYGVKKKNEFLKIERDLPRPLHTMLEKGGGCLQIYSAPGSGKSNMISNLFLRE